MKSIRLCERILQTLSFPGKHRGIAATILSLLIAGSAHAQSVLRTGDSVTWQFQFQYDSTFAVNSPDQPYGGFLILNYDYLFQGGPLEYRLDFFEDAGSLQPLLSLDVHHLTGLHDQFGMPLLWLPQFSPPPDAWKDLDGKLRLTILAGEMQGPAPNLELLLPTAPGFADHYGAVIVPEPGSPSLLMIAGIAFAWVGRCGASVKAR